MSAASSAGVADDARTSCPGGQAQWIALVPALRAPQLLMLDEPLAALDVLTKTEVRSRLRDELTRQLEVGQ